MERWQPAHYLAQLNSVPALPAKCETSPVEPDGYKPKADSDPRKVLARLTRVLQLLAPPECLALPAISVCSQFKDWVESESGKAVRRSLKYHASDRYHWSPINDGDDIEQRGLIFLWKRWSDDPAWFERKSSRFVGKVAFSRGRNDRYHYRRRRGNLVDEGFSLLEDKSGDEAEGASIDPTTIPGTYLPPADQRVVEADRRLDIQRAIEATIEELWEAENSRFSNGHRAPVELIARTICHAFMYHSGQTMSNGKHPKRTSSDGSLRAYWSQYISERQWYRWKPRVLSTMAKYLEEYSGV